LPVAFPSLETKEHSTIAWLELEPLGHIRLRSTFITQFVNLFSCSYEHNTPVQLVVIAPDRSNHTTVRPKKLHKV